MDDGLIVRRADDADFPGILELARRALGWTDDDAAFLRWKHLENPFGASPMWVALDGPRIVGFRTFLRWEFTAPTGARVHAARAVDTATDPEYQGRGIFTRLTMDAVERLPDDGVQLIFNTPNGKSLPGYLKMGWHEVGRLGVSVKPTSVRFPLVIGTARGPAGRWPLPTDDGEVPADALADATAVQALLDTQPLPCGLATSRSAGYLRWRYGYPPLGYRVLLRGATADAGLAVFRRRRRGRAVEGVLCDLVVPDGDARAANELLRRVTRAAEADYLLRLDRQIVTRGPFVRLPMVGPVFACRPLGASTVPGLAPGLAGWALTMGDVELF
jgi:GNAT superfamily N-acetyltransferase